MKTRRPSVSFGVAIIALVVALSGTAFAATVITTKQIKDGTILLKDINPKARAKLKGAKGATGAKGDTGAPGANGATNVIVRDGTPVLAVANGATGIATAQCNAGERATGGGNSISGSAGWQVEESFPTPGTTGSTPTGWRVDALNGTGGPANLVAIVICAAP
jgi:hypothetical protein